MNDSLTNFCLQNVAEFAHHRPRAKQDSAFVNGESAERRISLW